jgi:hypothetical protein
MQRKLIDILTSLSKKGDEDEIDAEIMDVAGLSPDQALIFICVHMAEIRRRQGKHSKENSDRFDSVLEELKSSRLERKVIDDAHAIIVGNLKERIIVLETDKKANFRWMIAICTVSTAFSGLLAVVLPWALK